MQNPSGDINRTAARARKALRSIHAWLSGFNATFHMLAVLALFFLAGALFPQGMSVDDYRDSGGWLAPVIDFFGLLDVFSSPLFIAAVFALFLNLVLTARGRYIALFRKSAQPDGDREQPCLFEVQASTSSFEDSLKELGFRTVSKGEWTVAEKGLPLPWFTWASLAGLLLAITGMALTYLLAFEGTMTLKAKEPRTLAPETNGRLQSLWKGKAESTPFHLVLEEFSSEYVQTHSIDYPGEFKSRLAVALGWKEGIGYGGETLSPAGWTSRVRVRQGAATLAETEIKVNDPFHFSGYVFYQLGSLRSALISVDGNPIPIEAGEGEEVIIPGTGSTLVFTDMRSGVVRKPGGATERIRPSAAVTASGDGTGLGRIEADIPMYVDGARILLSDIEEQAVLLYRYDPGVKPFRAGAVTFIFFLFLRVFGFRHTVAWRRDGEKIRFSLSSQGLLARERELPEKLLKSLKEH